MKLSIALPTHFLALVSMVVASLSTVLGQTPMTGTAPGWNPALMGVFREVKSFTAEAEMRRLSKSGQETLSLNGMGFSMLDGMVRLELDMTRFKTPQMPAAAVQNMIRMGMGRMVYLISADKGTMLMIYPGLEAYVEMPIPQDQQPGAGIEPETVELGQETLDDQPCTKKRVTVSVSSGKPQEILVWAADNLKGFPIQMQFAEGSDTIVMRYTHVKLEKPDSALFGPPSDLTRYANLSGLMQSAVKRVVGSGTPDR